MTTVIGIETFIKIIILTCLGSSNITFDPLGMEVQFVTGSASVTSKISVNLVREKSASAKTQTLKQN